MATAKKLSAAERVRKSIARNTALATTKAGKLDLNGAMVEAVEATKRGEQGCRVFAVAMRTEFGPGWYRLLDAEASGDNEKAVKKRLTELRTATRNRSMDRGCSNIHKAWSDMLRCARELDNPYGETREKRPLTERVRTIAEQQYKAIGKADIAELPKGTQEKLLAAQRGFAAVLAAFGVDIAAINAKL